MAKQKSRLRVSADAAKKGKPKPVAAAVVNLLDDEDDWIVVRKQRITILIPPLPGIEQLIGSNNTKGESHQPEMERTSIDILDAPPIPAATSPKELAPVREKSLLSQQQPPECAIPVEETVDPLSRSSGPHQLMTTTSEDAQINNIPRVRTSNHGLSVLKLRKQALVCGDGMPLFNQSMRAIKIERKIRKAGGLSCWLISLGLERFVNIFQQKKVNKFQLASLNMKKLKDMGAFAVGPRRKLLHALDCLCQPYCFEHVSNFK